MGLIRDIFKEWKFGVQLVAFILFCLYILLLMLITAQANGVCLAHGYPNARVTFSLQAYCHRVENGSTVIVGMYDLVGE